ncbi:hypothetical protein D9611_012643 [Ephemerocybe angulata]|uniref:F-box domain-containing protein n=2 Tax=Ephemerocybe angulata TaxID=980116 RepID=A0A8H5ET32_9AGAR|nr:hypothetical protein D9611_012643 [Tulosesus angulatus]
MENYHEYLEIRPDLPRRRRDLSLLPEMPLDVLLEIFSHLDPKDLLNMSRANKDFRRALLKPSMMHVLWRAKRVEKGAPEPPAGFSEAKWVAFLFNSFCYSCATPNVRTDFFLLKRLCIACKKSEYVSDENFSGFYPNLDSSILNFVPYTFYPPTTSKEEGDYGYHWSGDIDALCRVWTQYEPHVTAGLAGAQEAWEAHLNEQTAKIEQMQEAAILYKDWADAYEDQKLNDKNSIKEARINLVRQCFYELGYEQPDIEEVVNWDTPELKNSTAKITDRIWRNLRAKLEPQVVSAMEARLYADTLDTKFLRMAFLMESWNAWLATLNVPKLELLKYPQERDLWYLPAVFAVLDAPEDAILDFQPVINDFPNIAEAFIFTKREEMRRLVPIANLSGRTVDPLELATSVFSLPETLPPYPAQTLTYPPVAIGWKILSVCHLFAYEEEAERMGFNIEMPVYYDFDERLSRVAAYLVAQVGLDPHVATAANMDDLRERFICRLCAQQHSQYGRCRISVPALTWRAAVEHSRTHHQEVGYSFEVLRTAALQEQVHILERRQSDRNNHVKQSHYCNRCLAGSNEGKPDWFTKVQVHLYTRHNILMPVEDEDYIFNELDRHKVEMPSQVLYGFERA